MAENDFVNLFSLSYDAIKRVKTKDLVYHIENLKGKVVIGNNIQGSFTDYYLLVVDYEKYQSNSSK